MANPSMDRDVVSWMRQQLHEAHPGYRTREWDTRAGTIPLAIPKLRQGSYFPDWLLVPRRRERALVTVIAQAYLSHQVFSVIEETLHLSAATLQLH